MIYYFAYGSNLHPGRLAERVPSADLVGIACYPNHQLIFHKKGKDSSAKCNMLDSETGRTYGAIYRLDPAHKNKLDQIEGNGYGYLDHRIMLVHGEAEYSCFTYLAEQSHVVDGLKPFHWYKELVILGARYLNFPGPYIASIEAVESMDDPVASRMKEKEALIERISSIR
jgi:gamma-glutamylcyclotransferase (GGCT)/AIG2-like uncharacterized protein YtfP